MQEIRDLCDLFETETRAKYVYAFDMIDDDVGQRDTQLTEQERRYLYIYRKPRHK